MTDPLRIGAELTRHERAFPLALQTPLPSTPSPPKLFQVTASRQVTQRKREEQAPNLDSDEELEKEVKTLVEKVREEATQEAKKEQTKFMQEEREKMKAEILAEIAGFNRKEDQTDHGDEDGEEEKEEGGSDQQLSGRRRSRSVSRTPPKRRRSPSLSQSRSRSPRGEDPDDEWRRRKQIRLSELSDRKSAALEKARAVVGMFVEYGRDELPGMIKTFRPDYVQKAILAATGHDSSGKAMALESVMSSSERREVPRLQEAFLKIPIEQRHDGAKFLLRRIFSIPVGKTDLALWELLNLLAILKMKAVLSLKIIEEEIEKFLAIESERSNPPGFRANLSKASGTQLAQANMRDIARHPAKWREFVVSSEDSGRNRRELMAELERMYKQPLRSARVKETRPFGASSLRLRRS